MFNRLLGAAGVTFAVLTFQLQAEASDWQVMGVSQQTKETVALDLESINRFSQWDVRFRYLIGKDLVKASANCDSGVIAPEKGEAYQPNPTGATRNMLSRVCDHSLLQNLSPTSLPKTICLLLDKGVPAREIRDRVFLAVNPFTLFDAQLFVYNSVDNFCPHNSVRL